MYPICAQTDLISFTPRIETVPLVGWARPAMVRSSVVFPAPLSPRIT